MVPSDDDDDDDDDDDEQHQMAGDGGSNYDSTRVVAKQSNAHNHNATYTVSVVVTMRLNDVFSGTSVTTSSSSLERRLP
jgi:hypothetical protein